MLEPHGSPMKWPGSVAEEEAGEAGLQNARTAQARSQSQDDAGVHYVFQREREREPHDAELPCLAPKQRWAVGDDTCLEVGLDNLFYYHYVTLVLPYYYSLLL